MSLHLSETTWYRVYDAFQQALELLILSTPSGEFRNTLTEINIQSQQALQSLGNPCREAK